MTASAKPSRSINTSPGSTGLSVGGGCRARAIRREAFTKRPRASASAPASTPVGAPARRPEARTDPASKGRCARWAALARTASLRTANPARLCARGPSGVCNDSRISKRPFGRATTKAMPTSLPLDIPTRQALFRTRANSSKGGSARAGCGGLEFGVDVYLVGAFVAAVGEELALVDDGLDGEVWPGDWFGELDAEYVWVYFVLVVFESAVV